MLGNDIVDLQLAAKQGNWRRKGYLQKIFTSQEQDLISNATDQNQIVWLLWSMKEAAYKIVNRQNLKRFYSPTKFACNLTGNKGFVVFENQTFYTESEVRDHLIHTIAVTSQRSFTKINTTYLPNKVDYLIALNTSSLNIIVMDENGIPNLIDENGQMSCASVSHHGEFLAVVF